MKDYFGADASKLIKKKFFLFDMDGTIYEEDSLFDGTIELLQFIKEMGGRYVFITNNSSKSVKDYLTKLSVLGISAEDDEFLTSTQATILMLQEKYSDTVVYCQGTRSLLNELREAGINAVTEITESVGLILVGFDTELTSAKVRTTCQLLGRDLPYYATNPDLACPVSFGFIPDCGAICQMIEHATGRSPIYIGKPEPTMVEIARKKFGYTKEETVVIGDRLYTDIAAGLNAGVDAICVLTGEATCEAIESEERKPTYVFKSVKDILDILQKGSSL